MSLQLFDLTGRRARVTGSTQGIGHALARGLGRAGASLVLNGRNEARLASAVEDLRGEGMTVDGSAFDVGRGVDCGGCMDAGFRPLQRHHLGGRAGIGPYDENDARKKNRQRHEKEDFL